jgi:hypothetical protein
VLHQILIDNFYFKKYNILIYFLLFFLTSLVSVFYYSITSDDQLVGYTSDDAVYLLLADLYTFKLSGENPIYEFIRHNSNFPPLYPMILGLVGGNTANLVLAGNITVAFLLISIFLSGIWFWKEINNYIFAIIFTLTMLLLPGTLILSQDLWSEFLFMVFLYGTFLLGRKNILNQQEWLGMSLLIALASFTRSIGIALAIAFCLILIIKKVKSGLIYAAISLLPFFYWNIAREVSLDRPNYINTFFSTIADLSPTSMIEYFYSKIFLLFNSMQWLFTSIETNTLHQIFSFIIISLIIILSLYGFTARIKLLKLDAIFILIYLAIIFLWPFNSIYFISRFIYPIFPIILLYSYIGTQSRLINSRYNNIILISLLTSLIIIMFPSTNQYIQRAYADVSSDLKPYTRHREWLMTTSEKNARTFALNSKFIHTTLETISQTVPIDDCIYSIQAPLIMLFTKRISGLLPPADVNDEQFSMLTDTCKYFISMPLVDSGGHYPAYYPIERLDANQYKVTAYYHDSIGDSGAEIVLLERISDTYRQE